jgi:hypothetical protein
METSVYAAVRGRRDQRAGMSNLVPILEATG